jgi:hypothetical protein
MQKLSSNMRELPSQVKGDRLRALFKRLYLISVILKEGICRSIVRGLPSQVKGDRLRAYFRRNSWVRIPSLALISWVIGNKKKTQRYLYELRKLFSKLILEKIINMFLFK